MWKTKYLSCFYHSILFFCSIAINHSADFDYKDFMKIYRECTKDRFNFLTIETTLPASDPLRFRKNLLPIYKNDSN